MNKPDLRDYVDVASRILAFKEKHPDGSLQSEVVELSDKRVVVKAYAYRDKDDTRPGTGHAAERIPGTTPYTAGSELMVCETSAWGRAIAALGFEVKRGIATSEEVQAAQARQTAPVGEPPPPSADPATSESAAPHPGPSAHPHASHSASPEPAPSPAHPSAA